MTFPVSFITDHTSNQINVSSAYESTAITVLELLTNKILNSESNYLFYRTKLSVKIWRHCRVCICKTEEL